MNNLIRDLRDSAAELKNLRSVTGAGLLLALSVLLTYFFRLDFGGSLSVGLAFTATALMGMIYGPVVTGLAAGLGDILKWFLKPQGPYFFGYTFNVMVAGMLYGLFLYGKKPTLLRSAAAKTSVNLLVNAIMNTFWMGVLGGKGFYAMIPVRIVKNLTLLPVEIAILYVVLNAAWKALLRAGYLKRRAPVR